MSNVTQDDIISTIKRLDGIIHKTFVEGYPYQRLRGFYLIHLKKTASWPSVIRSKNEKVIEARISSPAFQMAHILQEYSWQAQDHPTNELDAWHAVLRSAAKKKYIPYAPEAALFPPIATLPVADHSVAGTFATPTAGKIAMHIAGAVAMPVAGSVAMPVAATGAPPVPAAVADPAHATVAAPPAASHPPISTTSAKVRTAVITAAGNRGHRQSAAKKLAPTSIPGENTRGATPMSGTEKVQRNPGEKAKEQAGKQKPNPEEDSWYIDGVHATPCPNCGKGKKPEEGTLDVPKKAKVKPKRKAPITPEYVTDEDEESLALPAPAPKPAHVIFPADPIRVITTEDVAAARRQAQQPAKRKPVAPRPRSPTPGPSNDPLLAAALQARVTLPSHTPPPDPRRRKEGDWFEEMVEYVDEVNAGNVEHQQRISSAVGRLSAIVDALLNSSAALEELRSLTSRVSNFEDSTDTSFKRLKERILKHRGRCDQTSARVTDLEQRIEKLERRELEQRTRSMHPPSLIAGPSRQGCTFVSLSPSESSAERSDDDGEGEEGQAGQEDEGGDLSSGMDTGMDDFSDDPSSPSSQDEPEAGEVNANIAANAEMEVEVGEPSDTESTDGPATVPVTEGPAQQLLALSNVGGAQESPVSSSPTHKQVDKRAPIPSDSAPTPGNNTPIPDDTAPVPDISGPIPGKSGPIPGNGDVKRDPPPQISLGGGPIIPGVAEVNPPPTTGGATFPVIHLINPTPDNSQEQLPPPGPSVRHTSPRLHPEETGRALRSRPPAPGVPGNKRKADDDDAGGRTSKPPSKCQHK
ncbi:hypothetical protein DXG01_000677 [Tephrocybe rancida]|nr:hypothetical protein DXG01_000677 [Tephrocybe rancida]